MTIDKLRHRWVFGQLYPATLLARLVTLELAHRDRDL